MRKCKLKVLLHWSSQVLVSVGDTRINIREILKETAAAVTLIKTLELEHLNGGLFPTGTDKLAKFFKELTFFKINFYIYPASNESLGKPFNFEI